MANIIINVAAKIFLNFTPINVTLIREVDNSIPVNLNFSSGTGQVLTSGQQLYNVGTPGQPGYLRVIATTNSTLTGSGNLPITVLSHPTSTQANQTVTFQYDGSNIVLNLTYNSKPETSDININLVNRAIHSFTTLDFVNNYTDFDGDNLVEIMATNGMGDLIGYEYDLNGTNNWVSYTSGTWIPINNVTRLRYVALNQNAAYTKTNPWFAKDSQGNISE